MSLVKHVEAEFDGERRRFEIKRERLTAFEAALRKHTNTNDDNIENGASAYAAMKRFHKGGWKASDVEEALAFGLETIEPFELDRMSRTLEDIEASRARFFGTTFTSLRPKFTHIKGDVLGPIMRDGHAAYAPLAEAIIRAALFGILPEEADFDTYTEAANA